MVTWVAAVLAHHVVIPVSSILCLRLSQTILLMWLLLLLLTPSCHLLLPNHLDADCTDDVPGIIGIRSSPPKTCVALKRRFLAPQYWETRKGSISLPSPSVSKTKGPKLKGSEVKAQWWKNLWRRRRRMHKKPLSRCFCIIPHFGLEEFYKCAPSVFWAHTNIDVLDPFVKTWAPSTHCLLHQYSLLVWACYTSTHS